MDKCITTDGHEKHDTLNTTQIVYNYEFVDDFGEPQLSALGSFLLRKVLGHESQSEERDIPLVIMNDQAENGDPNFTPFMQQSDHRTTVSSVNNWGPKIYDNDNHTMSLMVRVIFNKLLYRDICIKHEHVCMYAAMCIATMFICKLVVF